MIFVVQSRIAPLSCCGRTILPLGNWDSELVLQLFRQSVACLVVSDCVSRLLIEWSSMNENNA